MNKINKILKEQVELIKPEKEVLKKINHITNEFCNNLNKKLKKRKINAEVFIGGSLAKNTLVKKDKYDVDIFVRFGEKYDSDKISRLLGKVLGNSKKIKKIHGSRDYYQIIINQIILEIIPVKKIKKPEQAQNITDLSYFHVNYIKKRKKLADEIRLIKVFTHMQNCYGAESYIHGFSGYALELLICHYKSFLKLIKEIAKKKITNIEKDKTIIDDSKFYRKKENVLRELNESKIKSPIILIDPTFKERNVLAGLSYETLIKFQKICKEFLKKPSPEFFEKKDISKELKNKYKNKLNIISIKTNKQAGDIAGTKSKKFFNFFNSRLKKEFEIKKNEFEYNEKQNTAFYYFVLDKKKDETIQGPPITFIKNSARFKKAHPKSFIKNKFIYVKISHNLNFEKFIKIFLKKEKKIIKEMCIKEMKLV